MSTSQTFTPIAARPSPTATSGWLHWLRQNLFSSPGNTATTLFLLALAIYLIPGVLEWGLFQAVFAPNADACQAARGTGACWGVVSEKYRIILLGRYPFEEHWRPVVATSLMLGGLVLSCMRAFWKPWLVLMWIAILAVFFCAHVRWCDGLEQRAHRPVGRPATDHHARHVVDLHGLPLGDCGGFGPTQRTARHPRGVHHLH